MNNSNKFAILPQLITKTMISHLTSSYYDNGSINKQNINFNSSSQQLNSLTSITATCDRNTTAIHGYSNNTTAFNDESNTTDFTDKRKY